MFLFLVHISNEYDRETKDNGFCVLDFEGVELGTVAPFIFKERTQMIFPGLTVPDYCEEEFNTLLRCLEKYGNLSTEFMDMRIDYHSGLPIVDISAYLSLEFYGDILRDDGLYFVAVDPDESIDNFPIFNGCYEADCVFSIYGREEMLKAIYGREEMLEAIQCYIQPMSRVLNMYEMSDCIDWFYGEDLNLIMDGTAGGRNDIIDNNIIINNLQVLYVGAGLCCCIMDNRDWLVGCFDMGKETPLSKAALRRYNPTLEFQQTQWEQHNINQLKQSVDNMGGITVIISHWHSDHILILYDLAMEYLNQCQHALFWSDSRFYFPVSASRQASLKERAILNAIRYANNTVTWQDNRTTSTVDNLNNGNLIIYGCNGLEQHPHDHGIYATLRLQSGRRILLPGDCTYDSMSDNSPNAAILHQHDYLIATHHGGTYTSGGTYVSRYLPTPKTPMPSRTPSEVIYSVNGVAYNHPNAAVVNGHSNQGWKAVYTHIAAQQNQSMQVLD